MITFKGIYTNLLKFAGIMERPLTVKERNALYASLDCHGKKMMVLKDALEFAKVTTTRLSTGTYGVFISEDCTLDEYDFKSSLRNPEKLQEALWGTDMNCTVCARGAILCSRVRVGNNYSSVRGNIFSRNDTINGLSDCFTTVELELIESAFELNPIYLKSHEATEIVRGRLGGVYPVFVNYIIQNYNSIIKKRFEQIITNIIEANGDVAKGLFKY